MHILKRVQIWNLNTNEFVEASIVELTRNLAQTKIDGKWWQLTDVAKDKRKNENDNHWNWTKNVGSHRKQIVWECVAVLSQQDEIEGAMILRFDVKSRIEQNAGCVYIDLLATAPRNREWLVKNPIYKGVGTELVYWAVRRSYEAGFGGVVSLDADPKLKTLEFYENRGFKSVTRNYEELTGYELTIQTAARWLKERGDLS